MGRCRQGCDGDDAAAQGPAWGPDIGMNLPSPRTALGLPPGGEEEEESGCTPGQRWPSRGSQHSAGSSSKTNLLSPAPPAAPSPSAPQTCPSPRHGEEASSAGLDAGDEIASVWV